MMFDIYTLILNFLLKCTALFFSTILEFFYNNNYEVSLILLKSKMTFDFSDNILLTNFYTFINTDYVLTWSTFSMVFEFIILSLVIIVPLLISIAYYTLAERKVMAAIQRRKGPNVVGFWGLLQPLADGLKLVVKEMIIPRRSNIILFIFAPMLTLVLSFLLWAVIPFNLGNCFIDLHLGVLYILAISGLAVYGVVIAGWASNSKYAFIGALRASAQMISYEVSISLVIVQIVLVTGSLNLTDIVLMQKENVYNIFLLFPICIIFFISILAETNRAPFDLAEAEAEIVAGYNLEYSAIIFAMFFLGEYCNMIAMSALTNIFFFGGWCLPFFENFIAGEFIFALKTVSIAFLFIVVRAMLPRYRYDQLMVIG
jgi:NADH-quinone oxidoreductase subunit H